MLNWTTPWERLEKIAVPKKAKPEDTNIFQYDDMALLFTLNEICAARASSSLLDADSPEEEQQEKDE